jgi:hypothetical protein
MGTIPLRVTGQTNTPTTPETAPGLSNMHWQVGERLEYRLYWGLLPVGTATVTTEWIEENGRRLIAIRLRTFSNKVIEKIYPVDDAVESLIDPATFLPVRFTKNLSEGRHRYYEVTDFDHTLRVAHWQSKISGRRKELKIDVDTRDIPSFMYYMRVHKFATGTKEHFQVMADDKVYDLWVNTVLREKVKLPRFGAVPCLRLEPDAAFNGLFVRKGRIWVWISDDPRCLGIKMVASIPVANVRALLYSVEGPGDDFWTRKTKERAEDHSDGDSPDPQP